MAWWRYFHTSIETYRVFFSIKVFFSYQAIFFVSSQFFFFWVSLVRGSAGDGRVKKPTRPVRGVLPFPSIRNKHELVFSLQQKITFIGFFLWHIRKTYQWKKYTNILFFFYTNRVVFIIRCYWIFLFCFALAKDSLVEKKFS